MTQALLEPAPGAARDFDLFPASYAQAGLWLHEQIASRAAYTVSWGFQIRGGVRADCLREALSRLIARHETLRTTFGLEGGVPVQRIHPEIPTPFVLDDLSSLTPADATARAGGLAAADAAASFDLASGPLLRARLILLPEREAWFLINLHHIITDEWSSDVLFRELAACYNALANGAEPKLEPLPIQYADFAVWQREWVDGEGSLPHERWWTEQLANPLPDLELNLDHPRREGTGQPGQVVEFELPSGSVDAIRTLASRHGTTPFSVCLAAWAALLHRHTGQPELIVGTPITGRGRPELEGLVGFFINMLPIRLSFAADPPFAEMIDRVRDTVLEAMQHQELPFERMVELVHPERHHGRHPIFQSSFVYVVERPAPFALTGLEVLALPDRRPQEAKFDLSLLLSESHGKLRGCIEYRSDLFDSNSMLRLQEQFLGLLGAGLLEVTRPVSQLPLLSERERHRVVVEWNATLRPYPEDATLLTLLDQQARQTPSAEAVRFGRETLSYETLHRRANQLARFLMRTGVRPGERVVVSLDRSIELVVGLLAVVKAGAAYVPIAPDAPPEMLARMLEDAEPRAILTTAQLSEQLPGTSATLICLDRDAHAIEKESKESPESGVAPTDPAYMIFTSGTTGRPKGALNSHRGIVNRLCWMREHFQPGPVDAVLQKTPFGFDVSVWEIFLPLISGARLVLAPPGSHRDPEWSRNLIRQERITIVHFVPSMLRPFLATVKAGSKLPLREVICSGEALSRDLVEECLIRLPARLSNLYGPTEAAIDVTYWTATSGAPDAPVPIGRPIANTAIYILDSHLEPVPIGVAGELFIGGVQVGSGYLGRPELTAERFIADPFVDTPAARLYRTGDRARWLPSGGIEFLGRLDQQVKIRGHRIELTGIEAILARLPGVAESAVTVGSDATGNPRLIGHVAPASEAILDPAELRSALRKQLPDAMIPSLIRVVPSLPRLLSGKVDRGALAREPVDAAAQIASVVSAETTLELALRSIWSRLLGVPTVALDDDFFALGGHSLLGARMVEELEQGTGYRVPIGVLFEASTIRALIPRLLNRDYPPRGSGMRTIRESEPGRSSFFMLTGDLTGGGFYCRGLAASLPAEEGLIAIAPMQPDDAGSANTVERMASVHLTEIRAVQRSGPYRLGGYCVGGLIAYEMARQLVRAGESVELLLLIDPSDPDSHGWITHTAARFVSAITSTDAEARLTRTAYLKQRARAVSSLPMVERLVVLAEYPLRAIRRRRGLSRAGHGTPDVELSPDTGSRYERTTHHHARAQHAYRHHRYSGRVDLLLSAETMRDAEAQLAAWKRVAPATVLHRSESGHSEVVFTDLPVILHSLVLRTDTGRDA